MAGFTNRPRAHVDFNEMDERGWFFVLPDDVAGELSLHGEVSLYDAEGNLAVGTVVELLDEHQAMIAMLAGSWLRYGTQLPGSTIEDQVSRLRGLYGQVPGILSSLYQWSVAPAGFGPQTAPPVFRPQAVQPMLAGS